MWRDIYVAEKLRDLAADRGERAPLHESAQPKAKPWLTPLVRLTGRSLRRLGEGLESWAATAHQEQRCEQPRYEGR